MNCPLCGHEVSDGVKYCPICGANVEAARIRAQGGDPRSVYYQTQTEPADGPAFTPEQRRVYADDTIVAGPDSDLAQATYYDYETSQQTAEQQAAIIEVIRKCFE